MKFLLAMPALYFVLCVSKNMVYRFCSSLLPRLNHRPHPDDVPIRQRPHSRLTTIENLEWIFSRRKKKVSRGRELRKLVFSRIHDVRSAPGIATHDVEHVTQQLYTISNVVLFWECPRSIFFQGIVQKRLTECPRSTLFWAFSRKR